MRYCEYGDEEEWGGSHAASLRDQPHGKALLHNELMEKFVQDNWRYGVKGQLGSAMPTLADTCSFVTVSERVRCHL